MANNTRVDEFTKLLTVHIELSKLVSPATPGALVTLRREQAGSTLGRLLGPVRLVRQLMVFAILSLVAFVALAVLTQAGSDLASSEVSAPESSPAWAALYLLTAAGLGAAFAGLMKVTRYISNSTYSPKYEFSYWSLIVLGLIAGMILALLIPASIIGDAEFSRPLLALLGGFSAAAVYKILQRLVETLTAAVQGDGSEAAQAREQAVIDRSAMEREAISLDLSTRLSALRSRVKDGMTADELRLSIDEIFEDFAVE